MRAAVLGSPIAHSLSPALHRAAYAALGLGWTYEAHDVTADRLPGFVAGLGADWAGLSLTMPLKQAVIPLLDDVDELVRITGSCNTVVFGSHGLAGRNTDVDGIVSALTEATGPPLPAGPAVVVGGGATAASAAAALARSGQASLYVLVRDTSRAGGVLAATDRLGITPEVVRLDEPGVADLVAKAGTVVSTLPAGAADALVPAVRAHGAAGVLLDVVYEPWPTALAAAWQAAGGTVARGDAMLLHQAAAQVTLMTGRPAPVDAMRRGMAAERAARLGPSG